MKILKLIFIYKKYDNLRYVTFLYAKSQTLRKKQDNLRYIFKIEKAGHFPLRDFHGIYDIGGGGEDIFISKKQYTLRHNVIGKKQCTLRDVFI